jgi:PAS domain S-box-containing protein
LSAVAEGADDFFSSVLDAAPDGMLIADRDGTISFANRQASELFGMAHDDLVGSNVDELLPHDVRAVHRAHRLRFSAEPTVRPMGGGLRLRARRGDGTVFPVEVSLSPLVREGDVHVVAAVRDVTARVEAEENMRRTLVTLDATEDAVFIMEPDTMQITYANEGASRQVGYSADELMEMTLLHMNPELTERQLREVFDDLQRGNDAAISLRTTHRRRDGVDVPVEISLQAVADEDGGRPRILAVARDLSARLEADANKQLSEQVMAVADDRERIARDLHDTVIQRLFASGLALQALGNRVEPDVAGRIDGIVADLDQTIREIRTAIFSLQGARPTDASVRARCLAVVSESADSLGFTPSTEFDGPIDTMEPAVSEQLLPTLREALTNVAKHAAATRVRVVVRQAEGRTTLTVADDGQGLADHGGGHGLQNLRTRARELGGDLVVAPGNPDGTVLTWTAGPLASGATTS